MRCMPLATDGGASIWMTRSIAPMSIPSSSEEVATRPRIWPAFRRSSTSIRCGRASEPWCERTRTSPASSFSALASRSAIRRLLTKMSVERCALIKFEESRVDRGPDCRAHRSLAMRGRSGSPPAGRSWPCPRPGLRFSDRAASSPTYRRWRRSRYCGAAGGGDADAAPPRKRATSSSGRCVADSPMRCSGAAPAGRIASSRSSDIARCAPRLVGTSAWISSTITVSTARSASRAFEVNSR